ncbi:MAG: alpha/beta hydrolase [Lachnospiraceae bacterium]
MIIKEYGDSNLPKVVLLHPMLANGKSMLRLTKSMEGKYCFVAPDLSGHGEDIGDYESANKEAKTLTKYLKEKGYCKVELIMGASLGGLVGMYMLTDKEFQFKTAVFEGTPMYENAKFIYRFMKFGFLKKHRKALKMPIQDLRKKMSNKYGVFGDSMADTFVGMSEKNIVAIIKECSNFTFPLLDTLVQERIFLEVGGKDINCKQNNTILKHYPNIHIKIRKGYDHCMYMSEHFEEYGKLLEQYMQS